MQQLTPPKCLKSSCNERNAHHGNFEKVKTDKRGTSIDLLGSWAAVEAAPNVAMSPENERELPGTGSLNWRRRESIWFIWRGCLGDGAEAELQSHWSWRESWMDHNWVCGWGFGPRTTSNWVLASGPLGTCQKKEGARDSRVDGEYFIKWSHHRPCDNTYI